MGKPTSDELKKMEVCTPPNSSIVSFTHIYMMHRSSRSSKSSTQSSTSPTRRYHELTT